MDTVHEHCSRVFKKYIYIYIDKQAFVEAVGIAAAANHRLVQQVAREVRVTSRGLRPSSSDIHRGRRSDGGRPLVHAG